MSVAPLGSIRSLRSALANKITTPSQLAEAALERANRNAGANTFLWLDPAYVREEADRVASLPAAEGGPFGDGRGALWGLPVTVKDCFDLSGARTSCGTRFYREKNGIAKQDSWIVERLRSEGAVIVGKTHLHPLAYGITGENPDFGDCCQPGHPDLITGGSSSGAAASVLEGSAVAAIGTDTGGSIRVPAALCGLAGYRASVGRGNWHGGAHLAPSFDTLGWLFADLEEAPLLGALFADREPARVRAYGQFAMVHDAFLHDCEPEVMASYREIAYQLEDLGLRGTTIDVNWWSDSREIFAAIQAWEAAEVHRGNFEHFQPAIRERLEQGARTTPNEIAALRERHAAFRTRMDELFARHGLVLLPAAPVARLQAGADHSQTRGRLLRYTTPFSLAGAPAVTIPCRAGGVQMAAARDEDEALLQFVAVLAAKQKSLAASDNRA